MGGTKQLCNELSHEIWLWCYKNNNWIMSAHLPGKTNIVADKESRSIHDNTLEITPSAFPEDMC